MQTFKIFFPQLEIFLDQNLPACEDSTIFFSSKQFFDLVRFQHAYFTTKKSPACKCYQGKIPSNIFSMLEKKSVNNLQAGEKNRQFSTFFFSSMQMIKNRGFFLQHDENLTGFFLQHDHFLWIFFLQHQCWGFY